MYRPLKRRAQRATFGVIAAAVMAAMAFSVSPAPAAPGPGTPAPADPDSALAAVLAALPGERVGLAGLLAASQSQSVAAQLAEADLAAAAAALRSERGAFDPELFGGATWTGSDQPAASLFSGAPVLSTETAEIEAGARLTLPVGTELSASLSTARTVTNSAYAALSPQYQTFGSLTVRQPLLRGFGPAASAQLRAAERSAAAATAGRQAARQAVAAEVEAGYWELYAGERDLAVAVLIRDRMRLFLEETRLRARAGLVGPSQVASAEVFLAEQEQRVLDAEEQLDRRSDRLASLVGRRPAGGLPRFRPDDEPPAVLPVADLTTVLAAAVAGNPDLQVLAEQRAAAVARADGARWDARPRLDVFGGIGGHGLSGAARDVVLPGSADTTRYDVADGFGPSWAQVRDRDYPWWNAGVVVSLPLGGRAGQGEADRRRAEVARAEHLLEGARRELEEQVRAQHRELERGSRRLELAGAGVEASFRQVEIGMIEYRNGRSTAFEVVRLSADLAAAQQRYSQALVRTARAAAALTQLTGGWYRAAAEQE
ncbi:MAG: TolC family protein [bacterium]|nr:TolC family protein [bacterium]